MSLQPQKLTSKLAHPLKSSPEHSQKVITLDGKEINCADPNHIRGRLALMDLAAVNGGAACHWGGPAAIAEMISALHAYMFQAESWNEKFNFVNDIGHAENAIYALRSLYHFGGLELDDLLSFRSIESKLTGHGESHLYPEGVLLSNGPLGSSIGQAQGLAMSDKLAGNDRITINLISDGAAMEGEAREAFAAIAGLAKKEQINPFILILSDNQTKLSGRTQDAFDMQATFQSMQLLGWTTIKVEHGNSLQDCYQALENAFNTVTVNKPVFIWLKTTKGYGVEKTEQSASGGHGFPIKAYSDEIIPFMDEIFSSQTPQQYKEIIKKLLEKPSVSSKDTKVKEKVQVGVSNALVDLAKKGVPIVSLSSDLQGSTGTAGFHKEFPQYSFDIGIAESNMVSAAAGFSKNGFIPVVDTFSAFGVTKGNLPLIMASLSDCPMIAVYSHAGFQDAADGASHQSLTYLSALASIPKTRLIVAANSSQIYQLITEAAISIQDKRAKGESAQSSVFFLGRETFEPQFEAVSSYKLDEPSLVREGKYGVLVSCGPLTSKALSAADKLQEQGIEVSVVDHHCINDFNTKFYQQLFMSVKARVLTVEDHQVIGGMGSLLTHKLATDGLEFSVKSLGVKGQFGRSAYKADELYSSYGLDVDSIVSAFKNFS